MQLWTNSYVACTIDIIARAVCLKIIIAAVLLTAALFRQAPSQRDALASTEIMAVSQHEQGSGVFATPYTKFGIASVHSDDFIASRKYLAGWRTAALVVQFGNRFLATFPGSGLSVLAALFPSVSPPASRYPTTCTLNATPPGQCPTCLTARRSLVAACIGAAESGQFESESTNRHPAP